MAKQLGFAAVKSTNLILLVESLNHKKTLPVLVEHYASSLDTLQ